MKEEATTTEVDQVLALVSRAAIGSREISMQTSLPAWKVEGILDHFVRQGLISSAGTGVYYRADETVGDGGEPRKEWV